MKIKTGLILIGAILLGGCMRSQSMGTDYVPFVPPTLVATVVNTPTVSPIDPIPAALAKNCLNILSFVDDLTIPDGTVVSPGEKIKKVWAVKNDGSCKWNKRYTLRLMNGLAMGASSEQELVNIEPGKQGKIEIEFTAPEYIGSYFSSWMAYDDQGRAFGDDIYCEIYVDPYRTPEPTEEPEEDESNADEAEPAEKEDNMEKASEGETPESADFVLE